MPKFLERKLEAEYGKGDSRVYATMNALGAMHGNKETAKGRAMQAKHERDVKAGKTKGSHPHGNLGKYLHPRRGR